MRAKVINLWAGPGSGKSTTAAHLFALMKQKGMKVELVREYAKELTYADRLDCRLNQLFILAEQDRRIREVASSVDWVITDSPLPVGLVYGQGEFAEPWFREVVLDVWNRYENINVFLERCKPFETYGRTESEAEARLVDGQMRRLLADIGVKHLMLGGTDHAASLILSFLERDYAVTH